LAVKTGYNVASLGVPQIAYNLLTSNFKESTLPTNGLELWAVVTHAALFSLWGPEAQSILSPSVAANNLSSLQIFYGGIYLREFH